MQITRIEAGKGKKYKVFGDDIFLFALYKKELKKYGIAEDIELDDNLIEDIKENCILKRAKERALYLLEYKPYSVSMMKEKLYGSEYSKEIAEKVILFLKEYHYLDDEEYVRMYVGTYAVRKSRKQLTCDLLRKGISKESIDDYFEQFEYSEQECFERQFERYIRGKDLEDWKVRQKVFRYFLGKGFSVSIIENSLKENNSCV